MTLQEFANRHRLRVRRDEDGQPIVSGRDGVIYRHGSRQFAVMVLDPADKVTRSARPRWAHRKRLCRAAGLRLILDGDTEGTHLFRPEDPAMAGIAMKIVRASRRRIASQVQLEVLAMRWNPESAPLRRPGTAVNARTKPGEGPA
jgi:hypothetical protein